MSANCDDSKCNQHQAPSGDYNHNDYSSKMSNLNFKYDQNFYPNDADLPDPQVEPIIPGAHIPIQKVGIAPVDLPIKVWRRDGEEQTLQAQASLYCSLDDANAKGLNLSRLYLLMHDMIKDHTTIDGIRSALLEMANKQGSENAYCKLRFKYPWSQKALRTRLPLTKLQEESGEFETLTSGERISTLKMEGHIAYDVTIEGRYHKKPKHDKQIQFFLTVNYVYSATCPCSFELATNATELRNAAANAHSQRSIMTTTIEFDPDQPISIEDLIEIHRQVIPTEVQIVVKRRDEQAFAELNGSNLLFAEDAIRLMYEQLDGLYDKGRIYDFSISTSHEESLHPWNAIAIAYKGIENGLS